MIFDTNQLEDGTTISCDICIVGSGPAGLSLANELRTSGLRVVVLESGQSKKTSYADELKRALTEGDIPIKPNSRERVVGGASLTWDGLSAPFQPLDFACRPWVPYSGWPIDHATIVPYYRKAAEVYGFPAPDLFDGSHFARLKTEGDLQFSWPRLTEVTLLAAAPPQRFGKLLAGIFEDRNLDLYTDATVTEIKTAADGRVARLAEAKTRQGKTVIFQARAFAIGAGGVENARLLLNSTDACPAGLGNENDQVGRYFMNHPKNPAGIIEPAKRIRHLPAYFGCLHHGKAGYVGFRLSDSEQRRLGALNSYVRFEPLYDWSDRAGVQLLINYIKSSRWLWGKLEGFKGETALRDYAETGDDLDSKLVGEDIPTLPRLMVAILRDARPVAQYAFYRVFDKVTLPAVRAIRLRNFMEMAPDPSNRVTLAAERDRYGKRLPLVRTLASQLDRRSALELQKVLGEEVQASGFGRLISDLTDRDPWPINADASHHMGSTRMGTDPKTSVVDSDCRLHSCENVYIAGSSVFPTSGFANPTFTLVALAIRLAEELRRLTG